MGDNSLTFQSHIEDAAEFGKHYQCSSKEAKSSRLKRTVIFIFFMFSVGMFASYKKYGFTATNIVGHIAIALLAAVLFHVYQVFDAKYLVKRRLIKMLAKGNNKSLTEAHTMKIESDGISIKSESSSGKIGFDNVEKIETLDDFAFIYIGAINAISIRKGAVLEGDLESFIDSLKKKLGSS